MPTLHIEHAITVITIRCPSQVWIKDSERLVAACGARASSIERPKVDVEAHDRRSCQTLIVRTARHARVSGRAPAQDRFLPATRSVQQEYDLFGWTSGPLAASGLPDAAPLADEHRRRAQWGRARTRRRWQLPGDDVDLPWGIDVVGQYRASRKGMEDAKDEPGGADFYYGEMEMRRLGKSKELHARFRSSWWGGALASLGDLVLLTAYWLVSGYGQRAWYASPRSPACS